jgi:hypothetical protein
MSNTSLPIHGQVLYYLADTEIQASNGVTVPANTMFAISNIGKNQYQLITKTGVMNIEGTRAQDIAGLGTFQPNVHESKRKMKKTTGILEKVLFEAESAIQPAETDPVVAPEVSLDQKVDKYLVRYEREAIPTSAVYDTPMAPGSVQGSTSSPLTPAPSPITPPVNENKKKNALGILESLFFEAEGAPEEDIFGGGAGGDPAGDMGGGDEPAPEPSEPAAPVIDTPKMNMNSYTRAVSRLINNYEALLNPKVTILARAKEYIRVNYDEATAQLFEQTMAKTYNITATEPERDQRDAPAAANAIYGGGGGGGGA